MVHTEERNSLLMGGSATSEEEVQGLLDSHHTTRKPLLSVGGYVAAVATVGLIAFGALVSSDGGAYSEHLRLRLSREGASQISSQRPPRGFEGWKGAPLWDDVEEIPVLFTKGSEDADFVVIGHSTDLGKDKYFLASLHKHGIHAALSGNGTRWHWFEDKLMGAKAALLQMSGNPVVMFADTTDVMFSCPDEEILDRFDQSGADILIGGESQLWPEIDTYFDMADEREFLLKSAEKMRDEKIGLIKGAKKEGEGEDRLPNKWANGGTWMGRRNDILDYFTELESYLVENVKSQGDGDGFKKACKPYKMSDTEYAKRTIAAGFFDDQTCLNRFLMESAGARNSRVKVDMDGSLMLSVGGSDPKEFKTANNGDVFWERTQKSPCVWHFNNPESKKLMPTIAKKFPSVWV